MRRMVWWSALSALWWAACPMAVAGSISVAPTTIDVPADGLAVFYVVNRGGEPAMVQIEPFDWSQSQGRDRLSESSTLEVSPPMARLAPGERQLVRLRAPSSGAQERSYRLMVSELPDPGADSVRAVRVLLRFSVPVFTRAPARAEPELVWRLQRQPDGIHLSVRNEGARHAKLLRVALAVGDRTIDVAAHALIYVLPGGARSWRLPDVAWEAGDAVTLVTRADGASDVTRRALVVLP
jgi:fimbrial chaperone protein